MSDADGGKAPLNIRITKTLKRRLVAYAERQGISQAAAVAILLDRQLPELDPRKR